MDNSLNSQKSKTKKTKTTKKTTKTTKTKTNLKFKKPQNVLFESAESFTDTYPIDKWRDDFEEQEISFDDAVKKYQDFSFSINGFLRKEADYYSDLSITELFKKCGESIDDIDFKDIQNIITNCINNDKQKTFEIIDALDYVFENSTCPKLKNTVLFRGTDHPYEKENPISKAFTSTTKSLQNLFDMQKKGDLVISKKCCINALIVDDVPYLDLGAIDNEWSYQQEVLLPRGLEFTLLGENMFKKYHVYLYSVKMTTKYEIPPVKMSFDLIDPAKMDHLLLQKERILNLKQFSPSKIDDIDDLLDTCSSTVIRFYCEKSRFIEICRFILDKLKTIKSHETIDIIKDIEKMKLFTNIKNVL